MAMGPASTSKTLANLEEALNTRPEPCIYKSQLESFLINVSSKLFPTLLTIQKWLENRFEPPVTIALLCIAPTIMSYAKI